MDRHRCHVVAETVAGITSPGQQEPPSGTHGWPFTESGTLTDGHLRIPALTLTDDHSQSLALTVTDGHSRRCSGCVPDSR